MSQSPAACSPPPPIAARASSSAPSGIASSASRIVPISWTRASRPKARSSRHCRAGSTTPARSARQSLPPAFPPLPLRSPTSSSPPFGRSGRTLRSGCGERSRGSSPTEPCSGAFGTTSASVRCFTAMTLEPSSPRASPGQWSSERSSGNSRTSKCWSRFCTGGCAPMRPRHCLVCHASRKPRR